MIHKLRFLKTFTFHFCLPYNQFLELVDWTFIVQLSKAVDGHCVFELHLEDGMIFCSIFCCSGRFEWQGGTYCCQEVWMARKYFPVSPSFVDTPTIMPPQVKDIPSIVVWFQISNPVETSLGYGISGFLGFGFWQQQKTGCFSSTNLETHETGLVCNFVDG